MLGWKLRKQNDGAVFLLSLKLEGYEAWLGRDFLSLSGAPADYQFQITSVGSYSGLGLFASVGNRDELIAIVDSNNANPISGTKLLAQASFLE